MLSLNDLREITRHIKFADWTLRVSNDATADLWIQWVFEAPDNYDPSQTYQQHGRKWRISRHMTEGEVVQTALAAALMAMEHEVREQFTYKGKAIFGPHFSMDALLAAADDTEVRS